MKPIVTIGILSRIVVARHSTRNAANREAKAWRAFLRGVLFTDRKLRPVRP